VSESVGKDASSGIEVAGNLTQSIAKLSVFQRALVALLLLGVGTVVAYSITQRSVPERCPPGRSAREHRCCWEGQRLDRGHCRGEPVICLSPYETGAAGSCILFDDRGSIPGG
jgi:hypothetical protein